MQHIGSIHGPWIAHWDDVGSGDGHFVLVLDVEEDGVRFMDGSTGAVRLMPQREFARRWSGYLLAAATPPRFGYLSVVLGLLVGVVIFLVARTCRGRERVARNLGVASS
jgi:ABC-type bacteriocin/lantibiotic exporter with double-glycine peptidase domain